MGRDSWFQGYHPEALAPEKSPLITKAPRVGVSFSTSRREPGIRGERFGGGGGCQFWTVFAAALRGTDDFQALAFGLFSGKIPGVHSGSVLVGFRRHFRRFMRAVGGGFGHFRRLMRAFGGCFGRVLSSLSADEPVSHALSIVELSSQPVALKCSRYSPCLATKAQKFTPVLSASFRESRITTTVGMRNQRSVHQVEFHRKLPGTLSLYRLNRNEQNWLARPWSLQTLCFLFLILTTRITRAI